MKYWFPILLLFVSAFSWSQKEILVTDLTSIKTVNNVQFSTDGQSILYSVQSIDGDPKDKWDYTYTTHLWMAGSDGKNNRQITFHKEGANGATLSPDGARIAFVRSVEGKPQLFILPLQGGEAWQLTNEKYGATNPKWFPDGEAVLFTSSIPFNDLLKDSILNPGLAAPEWPSERAGFKDNTNLKPITAKPNPNGTIEEIRAYLLENEKDKKAKLITKLNLQQEAQISNDMSFAHIYQIETKPQAKSIALTKGFYSYSNAQFIHDTDELLVQADKDQIEHPDRSQDNEIYRLSLADHSLKKVLGKRGTNYSQATISPSGKWIAFLQGTPSFVTIPKLAVFPINGNELNIKTLTHDRSINSIQFSDDETHLYITSPSNGGTVLYDVDILKNSVKSLSSFDEGISSIDFSKDKIAFSKIAIQNPSELFIADKSLKTITQISNHNDWLQSKSISKPEKYSFKNEKGLTIEYWVMKPTNYEAGKKYPAILEIHGGPTAMWGPGEPSMWHEFQYYCSKGYGVVYTNPRGSGGYGENFMRANIKDWSTGPASDVLKSLDGAAAQGWIDTNKLAITGGSYAGYLIAWIIAHDHRFKAACSQRGVYDLGTFFGEGNAWRLVPNYFGGYPWQSEVKTILEKESPINYVQNIRTPYLIFHGENDLRTGVIQSEQMYKSLKVMGKTVEYVRHPGATHELTRSGNNRQRIDQMLRTWEFFERFIGK